MYGSREVAEMVGISVGRVRALMREGSISPTREAGGALRFSFQDLLLLRTAKALFEDRIPASRIASALTRLRGQLGPERPLTGVHLAADGRRIVARDGAARWQPESGQALFDFTPPARAPSVAGQASVALLRPRAPRAEPAAPPAETAAGWYEQGCELEERAPTEAIAAYRRAVELDGSHADARLNLGRLLHEAGDPAGAVAEYRLALAARPDDSLAAYNLGVALEDLGREREAIEAYRNAVRTDDRMADAHYNLSRLYERAGEKTGALRHLKAYRQLVHRR